MRRPLSGPSLWYGPELIKTRPVIASPDGPRQPPSIRGIFALQWGREMSSRSCRGWSLTVHQRSDGPKAPLAFVRGGPNLSPRAVAGEDDTRGRRLARSPLRSASLLQVCRLILWIWFLAQFWFSPLRFWWRWWSESPLPKPICVIYPSQNDAVFLDSLDEPWNCRAVWHWSAW